MGKLSVALQEFCDESMRDYMKADTTADEQDMIVGMIANLRESLSPDQKQLLNQLLDKINDSDSRYSYEAFKQGVLVGMTFMANKTDA